MTQQQLLEQLGEAVAGEQDEALQEDDSLSAARARFLARPRSPRSGGILPRRARTIGAAVLVAGVAAAALVLWLVRSPATPIEFAVDRMAAKGEVDQWIVAPLHEEVPLRFSDGSSVLLGRGARARVEQLTADGGRLTLLPGETRTDTAARIVPARGD